MHAFKRSAALALAAIVAIAGCKGEDGATGPAGVNTGTITGKFLTGSAPVAGATVTTDPLDLTATTGADGSFTLANVPIGLYAITVSGAGVTATTYTGVNVVAGNTTAMGTKTITYSPITLSFATPPNPAGFSTAVALDATVTGASGAITYLWEVASGPTAGAFSATNVQDPTFTTGAFADMVAGGKLISFRTPIRDGLVGLSAGHIRQMTYTLKLTVTDAAGYTQNKTVSVIPAMGNSGQIVTGAEPFMARNVQVLAYVATIDTVGGGLTLTKPDGTAGTLKDGTTNYPSFVPDTTGTWVLNNGAAPVASVRVGNYLGAADATCGTNCHSDPPAANVTAKFKAWGNSAHGNHYWKYFEYDLSGKLVPKIDPATNLPYLMPTADPAIFWELTAPMTVFQFGVEGAEGNHYAESCISCHTAGYNKLAANGGIDEYAPYFPANMGGPETLAAPAGRFAQLSTGAQARAGIQCESCHGPFDGGNHGGARLPKPFFDSESCAVCHDRPSNHDRYYLWTQSAHSNLLLAIDEATFPAHSGNESCGRCHAGQGYADYLAQQQSAGEVCSSFQDKAGATIAATTKDSNGLPIWAGNLLIKTPDGVTPGKFICRVASTSTTSETDAAIRAVGIAYMDGLGMTASQVQPVTCQTCHDPHATTTRVEGNTGLLPAGFEVQGAGGGALCMTCHNGRNGARGDAVTIATIGTPHAPTQTEVLMGQNAYWVNGYVGAHAAVANTCVGCHVERHPASVAVSVTNHTFRADDTICADCHAEGVGSEALIGQWTVARASTTAAMLSAFKGEAGTTFDLIGTTRTVTVNSADVTAVSIGRTGPSLKFSVAIENPNAASGTTAAGASVSLGFTKIVDVGTTTPIMVANGRFAKASWNMGIVASQSSVVHNKTFTFQVLATTAAKVGDAAAGAF